MTLRMLIVFQVPAYAAEAINESQQLWDAQRGMIKRLPVTRIRHLTRSINTPTCKNKNPARIQSRTNPLENDRLPIKRDMPNTVPS